jgi:hypothetical protein
LGGQAKKEQSYFKPHTVINLDDLKASKLEDFLKGKRIKVDGTEKSFQDAITLSAWDLNLKLLAEELTKIGLGN